MVPAVAVEAVVAVVPVKIVEAADLDTILEVKCTECIDLDHIVE